MSPRSQHRFTALDCRAAITSQVSRSNNNNERERGVTTGKRERGGHIAVGRNRCWVVMKSCWYLTDPWAGMPASVSSKYLLLSNTRVHWKKCVRGCGSLVNRLHRTSASLGPPKKRAPPLGGIYRRRYYPPSTRTTYACIIVCACWRRQSEPIPQNSSHTFLSFFLPLILSSNFLDFGSTTSTLVRVSVLIQN